MFQGVWPGDEARKHREMKAGAAEAFTIGPAFQRPRSDPRKIWSTNIFNC